MDYLLAENSGLLDLGIVVLAIVKPFNERQIATYSSRAHGLSVVLSEVMHDRILLLSNKLAKTCQLTSRS